MKLTIELPTEQADRLRELAGRLGISPGQLARATLTDLLALPSEDFEVAARRVVQKNEELYRRLA